LRRWDKRHKSAGFLNLERMLWPDAPLTAPERGGNIRTKEVGEGETSSGEVDVSELAKLECIPCKGGIPPMKGAEIQGLLARLGGGWNVVEEHHLEKEFRFKNFRQALDFTNRVGELAEGVGHHPDIHLAWGKVGLTIWTHKIGGLSESDFIFAAKADALLEP
jgi:4a-hydroxytetrahydrobiopterin dehydratase